MKRRWLSRGAPSLVACLLLGTLALIGAADPAAAATDLQGTQASPNDPLFAVETGPGNPSGCDPVTDSTAAFDGTAQVTAGPFSGQTMVLTGTVTVGSQQYTIDPLTGPLAGDPIYGFPADYGVVSDVSGSFSIGGSVTGTFTGLEGPLGSIGTNVGSCYGVGAGDHFGYTGIDSGQLIAVDANVTYSADVEGSAVTGQMLLRQRQTCVASNGATTPGCGYTGLVANFYTPSVPAPTGHTVTVSADGTGQGTIGSDPAGITCPSTCSADFDEGTQLTLTATADPGSVFDGFTGACTGASPCTLTVNEAAAVSATFSPAAPPDAVDDSYQTPAGIVLGLDAPGLLGNDIDPSGNGLTVVDIPTPPADGQVTIEDDGSFSYLPNDGFTGTDQFTYEVSDGSLTDTATVTVTVTPGRAPESRGRGKLQGFVTNCLAIPVVSPIPGAFVRANGYGWCSATFHIVNGQTIPAVATLSTGVSLQQRTRGGRWQALRFAGRSYTTAIFGQAVALPVATPTVRCVPGRFVRAVASVTARQNGRLMASSRRVALGRCRN